ncbi:alpha/beta fold hydrolase [uncultured Sphaerochaeta sp.]|uniref:alpha/beta hydrolase family protein n=1 Tax=uncultured Sphaerochaeta sp. TaxID=886478 RepID=UPI002A0A34CB|nr:alpha/beta fold hydrolase [uncultured Sphaerochaeta sp.]
MKKLLPVFTALLMMLTLFGCATTKTNELNSYTPVSYAFTYLSRGVEIPAKIVYPKGGHAVPLVVLAHGHGGSKDENIGFVTIADALAKQGIASIRMDFPGCGASSESFQKNTLTNMEADVLAATEAAISILDVNPERVGLFGYSMGGRIALDLIKDKAYDYKAVTFLAPAASTEDLKALFGGKDMWEKLKAEAKANGFVLFTTIYGQKQELSKQWFEDLEKQENPAQDAAVAFAGKPSQVIYATDDGAVSPSVSQNVADLFKAKVVNTTADGHSYGFYSDRTDMLTIVVDATANFFAEKL